MAIPSDYKDILDDLSKATAEGRVRWAATKFDVEVSVSGSKFTLWSGKDVTTKRNFVAFALSDHNGKTLDTWQVDECNPEYDFMRDLYAGARRKAMEIPQRLASIREEFSKSGMIGDAP